MSENSVDPKIATLDGTDMENMMSPWSWGHFQTRPCWQIC